MHNDAVEAQRAPLQWIKKDRSSYALGWFGTVEGFTGFPPWIVHVGPRELGLFRTLASARAALERAARAAGLAIAE